jgi:mannosyl-oligosaccharide alpha-1,2-mannosidase
MLPTHRLRTEVSFSGSAVHSIKLYVNKPSSRWLLLCLAFAGSLWFLGPYFLRLDDQFRHHPHGHPHHQNFPPVIDEHGRHPPRPGARPRPLRPVPTQIGSSTIWTARAGQVKDAYLHAWNGYQKLAAPFDELLPVSDGKVNK